MSRDTFNAKGNRHDYLSDLIQTDIMACVDGHIENDGLRSVVVNRDKLKTQLCQIVIDRLEEFKEK